MSSVFIVAWSDPAHFNSKVMDKRYEKALERARQGLPIDEVFPELKESEDERIRKEIVDYFSQFKDDGLRGVDITPWIAYLEKQKEQKSTETSNIDLDTKVNDWVGYMLNDNAQSYSRKNVQILLDNCARFFYDYAVMCLDKPTEWSEEDEDYLMDVKSAVNDYFDERYADELCTWLKSIRPQPHWKPSEEQIQALTVAIDEAARCEEPYWRDSLHDVLLSLHTDLKKLF